MLNIKEKHFLGKGGQRECYIHPKDKSKVLKILYRANSKKEDVNYLEYIYLKKLKERNISFKHIAKCKGYATTNKGKALVFKRVLNYDNTPSLSLREAILQKKVSNKIQKKLLKKLKKYLFKEKILFIDYSLDNLFLKEYKENKFKLVIIDGLGAKRLDIKFWFYLYSRVYIKFKIKKQWDKFITEYYFERALINNLKEYSKEKLNLSEMALLHKGMYRDCYFHPYDETKLIKKSHKNKNTSKNHYEYSYFSYLKKDKKDIEILPICYGYQKVNDGTRSLIYELVVDYDNKISKSLSYYIENNIIEKSLLDELFFDFVNSFMKSEILLSNIDISNILCKKVSDNKYKLIMVDGLDVKTDSFNFLCYKILPFYRRYLLQKQIKKFKELYLKKLK